MLNSPYSLLNTVLNVKNRVVVSVLIVYPLAHMAHMGTPAQHPERASNHRSLAQGGKKNPNSKLEVQFLLSVYCFHTLIKLKNC